MRRMRQHKLALKLVNGFHKTYPNNPNIPYVYLLAVKIFIEDLSKVNPESVIGLISESRPLNASVIINIPSLTLLSEELRNAVFGNIETFLIGSLSVAEQNLISKYLPKIEKSQLQKIHMEKYGYIVFSSKPSGEIRNELYTYKNTSFPRPS